MKPTHYTELAKICPRCMGCRMESDGTLVLAHRNLSGWGMLSGRGIKSIAMAGAILCCLCHAYGDSQGRNDNHWWEMAVHRTQTWAIQGGFLRFNPEGGEMDGRLR